MRSLVKHGFFRYYIQVVFCLWANCGSLESPHDGVRRRRVKAIIADISGTKDRAKKSSIPTLESLLNCQPAKDANSILF